MSFRGVGGSNVYSVDVTIPPNTAAIDAVETEIILTDMAVWQIGLLFPPGPAGLLSLQIFAGGEQMYPSGGGQAFHPDNYAIIIPCDFDVPLVSGDYKISVVGWNLDDTWEHTAQILIWGIPY